MAALKSNASVDEHRGNVEKRIKDEDNGENDVNRTPEIGSASGNNGRKNSTANAIVANKPSTDSETKRPPNKSAEINPVAPNAALANNSKCEQNEQCQETKSKADKIREVVEQATSNDSKKKIESLLTEIQQLSDLEKLLLYLRLPTGTKVEVDPLKQSFVSSLGNRYEVTQTVTWIQTHLEEDSEVSLPKQEVYDGYCEFCQRVKMKPLSTADFGKVMKQVFSNVRPRRLGTRGNSRYCYAGLRKKLSLDLPLLPDLSLTHEEMNESNDPTDSESTGASSHLIREWAEKLLGQKFLNLKELACHLVENSYVDNRSVAAFTLLSNLSINRHGKGNQSYALLQQCAGSKHRETQLQLQRKLQERELIREQKKKLLEQQRSQTGRISTEKTTAKCGKKSQLSRQPSDNLRSLLSVSSVENSSVDQNSECLIDLPHSSVETPKEKASSLVTSLFETNCGNPAIPNTGSQGVCDSESSGHTAPETRNNTPLHCLPRCRSVPVSPSRRKSGDRSSGSSPRPSPLDSSSSNGCTTSSDSPIKSTLRGAVSHGRMTDLLRTPLNASDSSKTGKVLIPRVTGSQSSKMRFPTPTSIIIFPQISSVPITDYGNGQHKPKPKYKPIQPKPINCQAGADEGKAAGDNNNCECSSATEEKNDTPDPMTPMACASSQATSDNTSKRHSLSSGMQEESSTVTEGQTDSTDVVEPAYNPSPICRPRMKIVPRRQKRPSDPKDVQKGKTKRPCLQFSQNLSSDSDTAASSSAMMGKETLCHDSPQGEMNISTLENDALMEYLNETPSVDQEEELLQYFSSDPDRNLDHPDELTKAPSVVNSGAQSAKLSQLRKLLEENLHCKNSAIHAEISDCLSQSKDDKSGVSRVMVKDNMPTLRLLLSEQRHLPSGGSPGEMVGLPSNLLQATLRPHSTASEKEESNKLPPADETPLLSQQYGQITNQCSTSVSSSDNNLPMETNPFGYLDETPKDLWNQGVFDSSKLIRNADEIFQSSDSSSGCHTNTFIGNDMEGAVHALNNFETTRVSTLSEEQQLHGRQMVIDLTPFNGSSLASAGNQAYLQNSGNSSVPPSPNTRRRAFNFLPISPRNTPIPETRSSTQSPSPFTSSVSSGHMMCSVRTSIAPTVPSQTASTTTSPFVSPRSTPSSHCRSRHNSGQASSAFGTPRATPHPHYLVEQSSCLTSPFVSPHPTPVPFSRSRHNSSQNVPRSGLTYSTASSVSNLSSRSRHPSELLSPGSAPVSPLEHHGNFCDTEMPSGPSLTSSGLYTMPSLNDAPQMRSRHNSNSSIPSNSPRSAPLSPMIGANALDNYGTDQIVPLGKSVIITLPGTAASLPPPPPPPPRHFISVPDVIGEDHSKISSNVQWSSDAHHLAASEDIDTKIPVLHPCSSWPSGIAHRQIDPRLVSRQRHASVGSTVHHHPSQHVHPPLPDASSQEVSQLLRKPPQSQQLEIQTSSRSRSVPLGQMLQNAFKQIDTSDPQFGDGFMSRSYPATPIGQHSFTFGDGSMESDVEQPLTTEFINFSGGGEEGAQLYHGDHFGCDSSRRTLGDTLDLPQDHFQDIIPSHLVEITPDEFSKFAQELEQLASSTQS